MITLYNAIAYYIDPVREPPILIPYSRGAVGTIRCPFLVEGNETGVPYQWKYITKCVSHNICLAVPPDGRERR